MKIVIAGAGEVGSHLAEMLSGQANDITVIDNDLERLSNVLEQYDVLTVEGSPTSIDKLLEAGVDKADLFIAVSPAAAQDVNIVSALLAKNFGAKKVAARINNEEYMEKDNRIKFTEMGIDMIFYPEKVAAEEINGLLRQRASTEFMDFAKGTLQMIVFRLDAMTSLIGKRMSDFYDKFDRHMVSTVAISRNGKTLIPNSDTKLKIGDMLYIISKKEGIQRLLDYTGKSNLPINNVTILGGGKIGEMLAEKISDSVESVKIIEMKKERCDELSQKFNKRSNVMIVNGDGRNSDFLRGEGINECDAFVAVSSNTETNILACIIAKRVGVEKTIAEVENIEYIPLAEGMGVDAVINKKLITAGYIFKFTLSNRVKNIKYLGGTEAEVLEYLVKAESEITAAPIRDLNFPKDAVIGGLVRGNEAIIATEDTVIMPYDKVAVFALRTAVKEVEKFFE